MLFQEIVRAGGLWPIWLRLGLQDIRMRYRRSSLGVGWIFLNLAIMLIAVGLVYSNLLGQDLKDFLPFLTIGLVGWNYLTSAILEGGNAFIVSEGYIKQIGLPLYVYIFRFFVSITLTLLISLPAYFIIAFIYSVQFSLGALWALVGLCFVNLVAFLMIAIFSHLNVRFRDANQIASVGLQVMFFVTPIIWPAEMLSKHKMSWIVDFNPFFHLLEVLRRPLLQSKPATDVDYFVSILFIAALLAIAWILTKRLNQRIAYLL